MAAPPWWTAAIPLVLVAILLSVDGALSDQLSALRTPMSDDVLQPFWVLGAWSAPVVAAILLLGLRLLFDESRAGLLASRLIAGGLLSYGFTWLLGRAMATAAAALGAGTWLESMPGSFPSPQAAVAFAFAGAIAAGGGRLLTTAALLLASLSVVERGLRGADAVSALVAGAWLGWAISGWVARRLAPGDTAAEGLGFASGGEVDARPEPPLGRVLLGLALLLGPLLFLELGGPGFGDPDEGRYAAIPYEMIQRGDYVTPTLNYLLYFEKPPLLYWCVAGAFQLFGASEWSARLVPVLASMAGVLTALFLGRRMFGARAGRLAAAVLATCPIWLSMGRFLVTDMLFSALVFACLATWWAGHAREQGARVSHDVAFWALLGLAVLCKGPLAIVLVFGTVGLYALVGRRLKDVFRVRFLLTSLVGLAVAAPWFVMVAQRNPSFNHAFWYTQHLARFLGSDHSGMHEEGPLFLLPYLPALFIPWVLLLPGAVVGQWRSWWPADTPGKRAGLYLACGCVFMTVFFSASSGKLQIYLLPLLPLLAVGFGGLLNGVLERVGAGGPAGAEDARRRTLRAMCRWARVAAVVLVLGAVAGLTVGSAALREIEARGPGLVIALAVVLLVWAAVLVETARREDVRAMLAVHAGGSAALVLTMVMAMVLLMPNHSMRPLIRYIQPGLDAGAKLITYRGWMQSLSFYADRRIRIFHQSGEFEFGLAQLPFDERAYWYDHDLEDAAALLDSPLPAYCIFKNQDKFEKALPNLDVEVYEIIWNQRRSIVGNAAAAAITPPREGGLLGDRWEQFK